MGGIRLSVHPLFYAFGFYYALTGRIFVFVIYTVCAVLHELGHSFVASSAGYRLDKITLMPFGAVVSGEIEGLKFIDEIKIALAGPFLNLAIGLLVVAIWWIFPECYAFTDVVAQANFSMAVINLLPVFPLDGGRVLSAFVAMKFNKKVSDTICKIVGGIFSIALLALFVFSLFSVANLSLLFFSLFVFFGVFGKSKDNKYIKMYTQITESKLRRGLPFKKQALSKNVSVKKMMSLLDENCINEIVVFDGERAVAKFSEQKIKEIIEKGNLYSLIGEYI